MFGLSGEHLLILAAVLLIFGPRKLPELGSSIGKALKNFKEGLNSPPSSGHLEARNATVAERTEGAAFGRAPGSTVERPNPVADNGSAPVAEEATAQASAQNPAAPTA